MNEPSLISLSENDRAILRKLIARADAQNGIPREVAAEIIGELSREALWKLQCADAEDVAFTAKCALPWWEQKIVNFKLNQNPALVGAIIEQVRIMQHVAREKLAPKAQAAEETKPRFTLRIA